MNISGMFDDKSDFYFHAKRVCGASLTLVFMINPK